MTDFYTHYDFIVFAGPNGSGKLTITQMAKIGGEYINVDDILPGESMF